MPDIARQSLRMMCNGIDLVHPLDRQPEGSFPFLSNVRVIEDGRLDGRPGYTKLIPPATPLPDAPNSIRRLNDPDGLYTADKYAYVGGVGTKLRAGPVAAYNEVDSGYSGDPLSLIPFRPDQSPESWMYVYDRLKSAKVRSDGMVRNIGVAPPATAPDIEYGTPAWVEVTDGQQVAGWANTGTASGSITQQDRTNGSAATIGAIFYEAAGDVGWSCIWPTGSPLQTFWMGDRMQVVLDRGGLNEEMVVVREVHPAINATTVDAIEYDSGTTGDCSIVLHGVPGALQRNSLVNIDTELVRVLEVINSPDGQTFSIRCNTVLNHLAGAPVTGVLSWFVFTTKTHVSTETITINYIQTNVATGTGGFAKYLIEDCSRANGRAILLSDDWLHCSVFLQNPQNVTQVNLVVDIDAGTTGLGNAFKRNFITWTVTQAQLNLYGTNGGIGDSWTDIVIPLSSGVRSGTDPTRTLANIQAVKVELIVTGSCVLGFDDWYFFGTYGPTVQPNAPVGIVYQSRYRDSSTGAHSIPSPQTRYDLFPLREAVIITPMTTSQGGVDSIDIYRQGATIPSSLYVGTIENLPLTPASYIDSLPDSAVLKVNQPPDLTAIQPWPILLPPLIGECRVIGTTLVRTTGSTFPLNLLSNTAILINGQAFLTFGQPLNANTLQLTQDAGYLASANFEIASPTVAGQPLPFAFGPLEGPFAPVVFALGDLINGGLLYFSNFSDADASSDLNSIEVSPPSSPLVSGAVWNGLCFTGTRDDIFCVRYSYLTTIGASNNTTFQWARIPCPSGFWSRWAVASCPVGVAFLGRDGIYIASDSTAVNISDAMLYPLFPHEGQPAAGIVTPLFTVPPVDMSQLTKLRLSYCDEELRFSYPDTNGVYHTLIYEIYKKRWFYNTYANQIGYHYLVESSVDLPAAQTILGLALDSKFIVVNGGNTDDGADIQSKVLLPFMDGGDERAQKLFVDTMTQADGTGTLSIQSAFNNGLLTIPPVNLACAGAIQQFLTNISSLAALGLYRNISALYSWVGGPGGPRIYAWEMSGFVQPYLSSFFVTQFINLSFPGWKHMRRMYPALISNADILLTIKTQDGRTYGPYTVPSTAGQYRVVPQMLDQNIKDLAFAFQLDGQGSSFALFPSDFTIEVKEWKEETYINLAVMKA